MKTKFNYDAPKESLRNAVKEKYDEIDGVISRKLKDILLELGLETTSGKISQIEEAYYEVLGDKLKMYL